MTESLTSEQQAFLEECEIEFSDRFTNADEEFKKIYDMGIPPPPIMYPWYNRNRFNRDRAGGSRYDRNRDNRGSMDPRDSRDGRNFRDSRDSRDYHNRPSRFRPY